MTLHSGLRWLRATLGRFRWNGRNSVPGCPRGPPRGDPPRPRNLDNRSGVCRLWPSAAGRHGARSRCHLPGAGAGKEEVGKLETSKEHPRNMVATCSVLCRWYGTAMVLPWRYRGGLICRGTGIPGLSGGGSPGIMQALCWLRPLHWFQLLCQSQRPPGQSGPGPVRHSIIDPGGKNRFAVRGHYESAKTYAG